MKDNFYSAFESRYRGTRSLIKSRLQAYLPFLQPLLSVYPAGQTLDLGCGRGEWLELLTEVGFKPFGVDLDEGMLVDCTALNLPAQQGDAITYISSLPSESQAIVSAFHVVEHIAFDQLRVLVAEALRVLKPGGLLILETPNPENIVVATRNFYLDPTHVRPIPPGLLSFVAEHSGFTRVKTIRLQEDKSLSGKLDVSLHNVLAGASPDYSIVAQKAGSANTHAALDNAFSQEFGLSLEQVTHQWDTRFNKLETVTAQAQTIAQQAQIQAAEAAAAAQQAEAKAQQAEAKAQQAEAKAQQAEAKAQQAEALGVHYIGELRSVYSSRSWRLTAPLRQLVDILRSFKQP